MTDRPPQDIASEMAEAMAARMKRKGAAFFLKPEIVLSSRLAWLSVHGALCLALRHPQFDGESRDIVKRFVFELGKSLVKWHVLTPEELAFVEQTEAAQEQEGGTQN